MKTGGFRRLAIWGVACCFVGPALNTWAQPEANGKPTAGGLMRIPTDEGNWTRHFHLGATVGMNIGASFHEQGNFNISGNNAANGIYDDGYVRVDQTGNADGFTTYWGYDNASQYNAAAQTLNLHSASSYSTAGGANVDGDPSVGFELAYGDSYWYWKHVRIGWEFGFGLLPISITDSHPLSASVNQSIYNFNTGGLVVPSAPYQGSFNGPGPLLPGTPAFVTDQPFSAGTVTGSRSLEVMLYTLRLGPCFYWELADNCGLSLSAGPALGLVSGDYRFDETIITGHASANNKGSFGATDFVYGGYVNATLKYHVVDNGRNAYFYLSAQYMPLSSATFDNGSRAAQLNFGGQLYLSVGLGWPF